MNRWFVLLTSVSALSKVGNTFLYIALPWAILRATDPPFLATLSIGVEFLPYAVSPLIGLVIDRFERRLVFVVAEVLQGVAVAAIPFSLASLPIGWTFLALVVVGVGAVASSITSDFSLIPALVPPDRLERANSAYSTVLMFAHFIGPACAGVVVHAVGSSWALWCDAITFGVSAVVGLLLPVRRSTRASGQSWQLIAEGFAFFRRSPLLRRMTLSLGLYNLAAGGMPQAILVVGALSWGWGVDRLGVALSFSALVGAAGAHLGGVLWRHSALDVRVTRWVRIITLGALLLALPFPFVALAVYYIQAFAEGGLNVVTMTLRQRIIPEEMTGRVNVIIRMCVMGPIPFSALILGAATAVSRSWAALLPVLIISMASLLSWTMFRPREAVGQPAEAASQSG